MHYKTESIFYFKKKKKTQKKNTNKLQQNIKKVRKIEPGNFFKMMK